MMLADDVDDNRWSLSPQLCTSVSAAPTMRLRCLSFCAHGYFVSSDEPTSEFRTRLKSGSNYLRMRHTMLDVGPILLT